ncbi:hypothetical protein [Flagellimonas sediminis]|uniref:Uncharacterized protein n=1 Tax=Flagellimonas sediminis TaxID=2696468 RepID=A0A6I5L032_9FLAO|nr:hypothetical protein [Allomuricauda sediminis]NDV43131.1 hypothetical protein [Allomuricauda sediminis]
MGILLSHTVWKERFRRAFGFPNNSYDESINDYVVIDDLEHYLHGLSKKVSSKGDGDKYYRGEYIDVSMAISNLFIEKSIEEIKIEKAKKSLADRIRDVLGTNKTFDVNEVGIEELQELFENYDIDAFSCLKISDDFKNLQDSKSRLRSINRCIKFILNKSLKFVRNLKEHFKRNHSFHFKNLDDYHSLNLVNSIELARI